MSLKYALINLYAIGDTLYIQSFPLNSPKLFENVSILFSNAFRLTKNFKSSLRVLIVVSFCFLYVYLSLVREVYLLDDELEVLLLFQK